MPRKLGLNTCWRLEWDFSVLVRRGRGTDPGGCERPGPSSAVMTINLLLLSSEIIYILPQGYIYRTILIPEFSDLSLEPRPLIIKLIQGYIYSTICKIYFRHIYLIPTWNATSKK